MKLIDIARIAIQRGAEPGVVSDITKINEAIQRASASTILRSDLVDAIILRGVKKSIPGVMTTVANSNVATSTIAFSDRSAIGYGFWIDSDWYEIKNYYTSGGVNYIVFGRAFLAAATYTAQEVEKLLYIPKTYDGIPLARQRSGVVGFEDSQRVFGDTAVRTRYAETYGFRAVDALPIPPAPTATLVVGAANTVPAKYYLRAAYVFGDRISALSEPTEVNPLVNTSTYTLALPYADFPGYDVVYTAEGDIVGLDFCSISAAKVGPTRFVSGGNLSPALIGAAARHYDTDGALAVDFSYDAPTTKHERLSGYVRAPKFYHINEQYNPPPYIVDAIVGYLLYYSTNDVAHLQAAAFALRGARANRTGL